MVDATTKYGRVNRLLLLLLLLLFINLFIYLQMNLLNEIDFFPACEILIALNISNGLMCPIMGKDSIYYTLLDSRNVQQNTCTRDETIYGKSGRHTSVICTSFGGMNSMVMSDLCLE